MDKLNDGTLMGTLHDEDYSSLKNRIDTIVSKKVYSKIQAKKEEFMDKITGR